jgi:hypothetical protein
MSVILYGENGVVLYTMKFRTITLFHNPGKAITGVFTCYVEGDPYSYLPDDLNDNIKLVALLASYGGQPVEVAGKIYGKSALLNVPRGSSDIPYDDIFEVGDDLSLCVFYKDRKKKAIRAEIKDVSAHAVKKE